MDISSWSPGVNTDRTDPTIYLYVGFQILDDSGHILDEEQTHASARMRWTMRWDGNGRVVLGSSGIGMPPVRFFGQALRACIPGG